MVAHDERQRLLRDYHGEPVRSLTVVVKCAGCLIMLIAIAAVGANKQIVGDPGDSAREEARSVQPYSAAVESKNGFVASGARLAHSPRVPSGSER